MKDIRFNRERMLKGAEFYAKHGITPQSSQIRIETPLVVGQGQYEFDIKKKTKLALEKVIKDNDLFISRAIGVALCVEKTANPGTGILFSYPAVTGNLPTGVGGFKSVAPYALYNGALSIKTDQTVNISSFPLNRFLNIPETQPTLINNGTAMVTAGILPKFNLDDILFELPEVLAFAGNHTTEIKIDAPVASGSDITAETDYTARLVLIVEGWNFNGGANDKYKVPANPWADVI